MNEAASEPTTSRIVLVVGVNLDETSEHLLRTVRELTRGIDEAELHLVHVVAAETLNERISEPVASPWHAERERVHVARWQLDRLCHAIDVRATTHIVVHTPAGRPVDELVRLARRVGADAIVIEARDAGAAARSYFHRSVAADLSRLAPCSVLTVRAHHPAAANDAVPQ